ncbi:FMNL1 protein, partial [Polypterus senegalus]
MGNAAGSMEVPPHGREAKGTPSAASASPVQKQQATPKLPMPAEGELEERFNTVLLPLNNMGSLFVKTAAMTSGLPSLPFGGFGSTFPTVMSFLDLDFRLVTSVLTPGYDLRCGFSTAFFLLLLFLPPILTVWLSHHMWSVEAD